MEKKWLFFPAPTPFKIYQFFRPSAARPFRKIAKKLGFKWPENHPNIHKKSQIGKLEMERNQLLFSPPTPFKKKQEQEDFHPVNLPTFFVCQQSLLFFFNFFFFFIFRSGQPFSGGGGGRIPALTGVAEALAKILDSREQEGQEGERKGEDSDGSEETMTRLWVKT